MAGANFPRVHVWADDEDLYASDLNAEFDNVLNNLNPAGLDGYEDDVTEMQIQTSPGGVGTEVLATSLGGEIERLRYVINRIIGAPSGFWYDTPAASISALEILINSGISVPPNRVASGRVGPTSNQAMALVPDGTLPKINLKAATTNLNFYVANAAYTANTDTSLTGLTLAPSTGNTCLVNDSGFSGGAATALQGENGTVLPVDTMGSSITALVGHYAAFKIVDGGNTEYFIAYVNSTTQLTKVFRGYFFDHLDAPIDRITINDNDTITLMKLTWIFVNTALGLQAVYNQPVYSATAPTSPASGDYWFDLKNLIWKTYNGSSFVAANATLIGVCIQDTSGTKAARTFEYYAVYGAVNTIALEAYSASLVQGNSLGQEISVAGNTHRFVEALPQWNSSGQFSTGVTLTINTLYYLYVSDTGQLLLDIIPPYDRSSDLLGQYHPHNPWRCVGTILTDGSSNFINPISLAQIKFTQRASRILNTTSGPDSASPAPRGSIAVSASSGSFTTASTIFTPAITGVNLDCAGGPVAITIQPDTTGSTAYLGISASSVSGSGTYFGIFQILRDGAVVVAQTQMVDFAQATRQIFMPPGMLSVIDYPPAGVHGYILNVKIVNSIGSATIAVYVFNCVMAAHEF